MKKLILFLALVAVFAIGALAGVQLELNPMATGVGISVLALSGLLSQDGALLMSLDLTALNAQVGAYYRAHDKEIWRKIFTSLEIEKYCRQVPNVSDEYVMPSASITDVLQPYQKAWTPQGEASFNARINKVRQIKADMVLDNVDEIYRSYLGYMAVEGRDRKDWPIVRYIVEELIIPKMIEELNQASATGEYAAPTPGTPGAFLDIVDGFLTIIANEITATNLTPITTGAVSQSDALDKFELFNDLMPTKYSNMEGIIFCSATMKKWYQRDYRNNFGGTNDQAAKDNLKIDATKKMIVGLESWEGSQRMLFTPKNNMLVMYDKILTPNKLEFQIEKRDIIMLTDFKRGYGFGNLEEVHVNDQA